jgi:plastocyanin
MSVKSALSVAASVAVMVGVTGCSDSVESGSQPTSVASSKAPAAGSGGSENARPSQGSSAPSEDAPAADPVVIEIKNFQYHGPDKVAPGATIMVQNNDRSPHSLTSEGDDFAEVVLDGGGASGTLTAPDEPGEYSYVCKFHPEMVDTLVVE